jgi:hypothetical protein
LKHSTYAEYIYERDLYRFLESREEAHETFLQFDLNLNGSISIQVSRFV